MDIGSLTGQVSIEDQFTDKLTEIVSHVKHFAEDFDGAFGAVVIGAGVVTAAIVGAAISVVELGEKGSVILGVEDNFNKLAAAAGTTGEALRGGLSEGVKGTVDEMMLMQSTSRLLSSGMKLTAADTLLMGEAARAMGKASGTDATQGLGMLSNALLTGRTRSLAMAGIVVDLKSAEEKYAKTLGVTATELSREGKLHADRIAILAATQSYVDRLGVTELTFKERMQQGRVAIEEWTAKLEKSVASSPHVMAALDSIQSALVKAFGGDSQSMLDTIVGWVNSFADAVATYAPPIIQAVADIWHGIRDLWHEVQTAWDLVPDWFKFIARDSILAAGGVALLTSAAGGFDWTGWLSSLSNLAQVWSVWGATLVAFPGKAVAAIASQYALAAANGTLAGSFTALLAPIALYTAAIVGVGVLLYEAKIAWDIWRTSVDTAAQAAQTLAMNQQNLRDINRRLNTNFTDYGDAVKYAQLHMKELNQGHQEFIGPLEAVNTGIKRGNESLIDRADAAKKAAEAEKKYVEMATKHEALLAAEYVLTTEAYVRTIDKRLAADAGWREAQNVKGLQAMEQERKLLSDQGVAERAALNERNVLKMNFEAAQMALEVKNAELERSVLNDINVLKMNAEAKALEGTKGFAQATAETWLREYLRIKNDGTYTSEAVTAAWQKYVDASNGQATKVVGNWTEAWKGIKTGLVGVLDSIPQTIADALTGGGGMLGAAKAIGSQVGSVIGKGIGTALGGKLGGQIGEAVGSLVGPLIDAFAKVFDHVGKDIKRLGRNLGVKLSEGLIEQIRTDAKKFGGEVQGLLVNLSKVISEAGGLNAGNLELFTGKLHDIFSLIETHQLTVAAGTKVLDDNFQAFAMAGTNSLGLLDKKLRDIVALNDIVGTQSRAIADYVAGQATNAQNGFISALTVTGTAYTTLAALQEQAKTATGSALKDINEKMLVQQGIIDATAIHSQAAATAVSSSLVGIMVANMQSGMSFIDAVRAAGPGVEALSAQLTATGFAGGAAFDFIREEVRLANDEIAGPALVSIEGYTAGMVGLSNAGLLTQDTFSGLSDQIAGTEAALVAQGFSSQTVMVAMQGDLQTVWELQQEYGYTLDDTTQKLVDEAVAQGIVGEKHKSSTQQMIDASNRMVSVLEAMATFMGVTLPAAAKTGADRVQTALDGITTPSLPEPWRDWGAPPDYSGNDAASMVGGGIVYAAKGTNIIPFTPRGTDTVPAMLTPGERVLTVAQNQAYERDTLDFEALRASLDAMRRETRDARNALPRELAAAVAARM